jgi:hypothetical protein
MRGGARNFKKLIPLTFVRQPESLWLMLGLECTSALARAYVHEGGQTIVGKTSGARGGAAPKGSTPCKACSTSLEGSVLKARTSGPIGVRVSVIFRERIEAALEKTKTVFVWSSFPRHRSPPLATSVAKTQPRDFYWAVVHAPVHSLTPAVRGRTCRPRHRSARPTGSGVSCH